LTAALYHITSITIHLIYYYDRPIPCGSGGTYAHYGLLSGLVGNSIGAVSKDVRFYIDKLVEKFPDYFGATILERESKRSAVTAKIKKYDKDLLKWRWKQIRNEVPGWCNNNVYVANKYLQLQIIVKIMNYPLILTYC
jgi:hypothetical protein